jgi:hypothetical protein
MTNKVDIWWGKKIPTKNKIPDWINSDTVNRQIYKTWLANQMHSENAFPTSDGPNNSFSTKESIDEYLIFMDEYKSIFPANLGNYDFFECDTGYKLHLNVLPENVRSVSEYLKSKGYSHKYLSGGSPEDGKIFTIYTGSKKLTTSLAKEISRELSGLICRPSTSSEVEFAPNIVGRFSVISDKYTRYPIGKVRGMPIRKDLFGANHTQAFNLSFIELEKDFGVYFTG